MALFQKTSSSDFKCSLQPEVDYSTLRVAAALMTPLRHFGTLPPVTAEVRTLGNRNYLGRGYSTTQQSLSVRRTSRLLESSNGLCVGAPQVRGPTLCGRHVCLAPRRHYQ